MQITVRNNAVEIEGYVNAIERNSKTLRDRVGEFIERICKGAFKRALDRAEDVRILLNHDMNRDLGGIKDGNLELHEDNIGLHARATITDAEVVEKAKRGDLVGWSFGFTDRDVDKHMDEDGVTIREVKDLNLYEVSLLDRSKTPAYDGTLVCVRSGDEVINTGEPLISEMEIREEIQPKQHENVDNDTPEQEIPAEEISNEETEVSKRETEVSTEEIKVDFSKAENILKEIKEAIVNAD